MMMMMIVILSLISHGQLRCQTRKHLFFDYATCTILTMHFQANQSHESKFFYSHDNKLVAIKQRNVGVRMHVLSKA